MSFADCVVETGETLDAKLTLDVPADTVTDAGTVTELLLLARLTTIPPLGATEANDTVQLFTAGPVTDAFAHVNPDSVAPAPEPLPCNFTVPETLVDELVMASTLNRPVESLVDPGLY